MSRLTSWLEWTSYKYLNLCQMDMLSFIAEHGACCLYKMVKEMHKEFEGDKSKSRRYHYPHLHKNSKKLIEYDFLTKTKDTSGDRVKAILNITYRGIVVVLDSWESKLKENLRRISNTVKNHPEWFPFSKYWHQIHKVVGLEAACEKLVRSVGTMPSGEWEGIRVDGVDLDFKVFIPQKTIPFRFPNAERLLRQRNEEFSKVLVKHKELLYSYISYLAIHDIVSLLSGYFKPNEHRKFLSEHELAYYENREVKDDPLFKRRLKTLFPKYGSMEYMITGLFTHKLLWETREPVLEKVEDTGFHIYSLNEQP